MKRYLIEFLAAAVVFAILSVAIDAVFGRIDGAGAGYYVVSALIFGVVMAIYRRFADRNQRSR